MRSTVRRLLGTLVAVTASVGILAGCSNDPGSVEMVDAVTGAQSDVEVSTPALPPESGEVSYDADPIVIGEEYSVGYGGTVSAVTFKITSVDRCENVIRVGVEMTTGNIFQSTDNPFHRTSYVDNDGFTVTDSVRLSKVGCGDELASGYSLQPGQSYRGYEFFEIPQGGATEIRFHPMDHHEWSIDVTGK